MDTQSIEQFVTSRLDGSTLTVEGITFYYQAERYNRNGRKVSNAHFGIQPYKKNGVVLSGTWPAILNDERVIKYIREEVAS